MKCVMKRLLELSGKVSLPHILTCDVFKPHICTSVLRPHFNLFWCLCDIFCFFSNFLESGIRCSGNFMPETKIYLAFGEKNDDEISVKGTVVLSLDVCPITQLTLSQSVLRKFILKCYFSDS